MSRPRNILTYLDHLYRLDYKEHPVSTSTLLCNKEFFGTLTDSGRRIFPIWMDKLTEIGREDSKYQIVFTGAIGTGKTRAAVWGALQVMQRIMCLKDPYGFFNLAGGGKMAVVVFNLTKGLSESRAYSIMQEFLLASPWFVARGTPTPKHNPTKLVLPLFSYVLASPYTPGQGTVGEDVVIAIMDEVDDESSSEGMKQRILKGYDKTVRRFETRFVDEIYKESLGKFFLVSSKSERLSFLNTFIAERRQSQHVYVVDIPYWEARPNVNFSGRRFSVQLGDVYTPSKVITTSSELALAHKKGLDIIKVPVEYFEDFDRDVVGSLRDIAGVSVAGLRATKLFAAEKLVRDCIDPTKPEPMSRTTIEIGLDDDVDLIHFLDISKVRMPKSVERFIHCDISYASGGDCMGLAMSGISHWTTTEVMLPDGRFERRKVPVVETDFAFRLKARPGDQIPLFKMRKFILDLRAAGFAIKKFTAD